MYAYIEGKLSFKNPTHVHLDVSGVGYLLNISLNTYAAIEAMEKAKLYTYLHVKEDILSLYGFASQEEKTMFTLLISVSGIGPNTARVVLSSMTASEVSRAILHENVAAFNKVKGIGPKTAKRVILDLKDKVSKLDNENVPDLVPQNGLREEAISALMSLGFNKQQIVKKIDIVMGNTPAISKVEILIKEVLKQLS
ncbi:UNVERIFIED_CONTAM: hypothetical protein GTU68_051114 [Idotea baltica]|nr:hypothetical protein [Idotea baltica]